MSTTPLWVLQKATSYTNSIEKPLDINIWSGLVGYLLWSLQLTNYSCFWSCMYLCSVQPLEFLLLSLSPRSFLDSSCQLGIQLFFCVGFLAEQHKTCVRGFSSTSSWYAYLAPWGSGPSGKKNPTRKGLGNCFDLQGEGQHGLAVRNLWWNMI